MGQEIVYCFKCQQRIVSSDYAKGLAYQIENHSCCSACAVGVLDTLTPKQKELLLAKMFKATKGKQPDAPEPVASAYPSAGTRKIPVIAAPKPAGFPQPVLWGGIAVAVVLVGFLALPDRTPPPTPPQSMAPVPQPRPAVADPGPSAEERRKTERAKEAVRKAKEFEIAHPANVEEQVVRWRAARLEALQTGYEAEAERETKKAEARAVEAQAREVADLERRVREEASRKDFKAALARVAVERPRRNTPDGSALLDRLEREVRDSAASALKEIQTKATAARDRGAKGEVEALKAEVAKWGFPELLAELESSVAVAWTPIFDGKSASFLSGPSASFWKIEDGMLTQVAGQTDSQSGQSKDAYGDAEFRVRLFLQSAGQFYIAFRQTGEGSCRVNIDGPNISKLGNGDHELIFVCRGAQYTATIDGAAVPVGVLGKVAPKGRIQFNSRDGKFGIRSIEYRPL